MESVFFAGPIPHPSIIQQYEHTLPGSADRILKMAEDQSSHRQKLESSVIKSDISNERLGMYLSFIVIIIFIIAGVFLLINDKPVEGLLTLLSYPSLQVIQNALRNFRKDQFKKKEKEIEDAKKEKSNHKQTTEPSKS